MIKFCAFTFVCSFIHNIAKYSSPFVFFAKAIYYGPLAAGCLQAQLPRDDDQRVQWASGKGQFGRGVDPDKALCCVVSIVCGNQWLFGWAVVAAFTLTETAAPAWDVTL